LAREKAKKTMDDDAKKLINKGLKKLTVDDVVALFENTKRGQFEDAIRKNKIDGKVLASMVKKDLDDLGLTPLPGAGKIQLFNDLDGWKTMGVENDKLVSKTAKIELKVDKIDEAIQYVATSGIPDVETEVYNKIFDVEKPREVVPSTRVNLETIYKPSPPPPPPAK
jgi:hypothetical protein